MSSSFIRLLYGCMSAETPSLMIRKISPSDGPCSQMSSVKSVTETRIAVALPAHEHVPLPAGRHRVGRGLDRILQRLPLRMPVRLGRMALERRRGHGGGANDSTDGKESHPECCHLVFLRSFLRGVEVFPHVFGSIGVEIQEDLVHEVDHPVDAVFVMVAGRHQLY